MNPLQLPDSFTRTIRNVFHRKGEAFLAELPALVREAAQRWHLADIQPVPDLSYNFVAFAVRGADDVVLKIGVPHDELLSEIAALELYAGQGAVGLLGAVPQKGTFLLERLRPGRMLAAIEDDEQATAIAADVMRHLWRPAPLRRDLLRLRDWFDGFKRLRARFNGGTGPLPQEWVERAEALAAGFFAERRPDMLLHGDFHHFNVLESQRGWLAIDPKGVIGPPEYEVGPLLMNPWGRVLSGDQPEAQAGRRIAILAERLGLERRRLRDWAIAHAVLSAWWSVQDQGEWRYAIQCAELFDRVG